MKNKLQLLSTLAFYLCVVQVHGLTFTPVFYGLDLDFSQFAPNNKVFYGEARIYFDVPQDTYGVQEILLDAELLHIFNATVTNADTGETINVVQSVQKDFNYSLWIKINNAVSQLKAVLHYRGQVGNAGDTGVYITEQQNVIATNSYPLGAQKIFPCVNVPYIRTSVSMDVKLVNDKWGLHKLTDAVQSPFVQVNAVGFIMTLDYRKVDDVSTDRFLVWVPNHVPSLYDSVNTNTILKSILAKDTYFDRFFSDAGLDKIHIVMVPGLKQLSVVNHRLISIRPDFLLTNEHETAEMAKGTAVATLNALAKHFFRCVVSPKNWEDFWLADSVSLYLQYALLNDSALQDRFIPELFTTDVQRPAMRGSSIQVNPDSIDPNILTTDDVYPPAYQGASILKMMEALSSQGEIVADLFNYYKSFAYANVETEQFLDFMSNQSMFHQLNSFGKRLGPILDKWIHKTGYPYLFALSLSQDLGFSVTQEPYGDTSPVFWIIPFDYKDNYNPTGTLQWFEEAQTQYFKDSNVGSWILLNQRARGFFRVDYGSLLGQLLPDPVYWSLSASERAALVDDAYALGWQQRNRANLGSALSLFDKLPNETDYVPFSIAISHLDTLKHLYSQKGILDRFELKVAEILESTYSQISWYKPKYGAVSFGKAMWTRSVVESSCRYYVANCLSVAESITNDDSLLLNDLIPTVNCYRVRRSQQMEWSGYFNKLYSRNATQYARADALYALACPSKFEINGSSAINQYLTEINSDSILAEDAQRAFSYIYSRTEHVNQTMTYIYNHYSSLMSRFGDKFFAALITDISKLLLPPYYSDILNNLKLRLISTSETYEAVVKALAEMKSREQFVNANLYQVQQWINTNSTTYKPLPPPTYSPTPNSSALPGSISSKTVSSGVFVMTLCLFSWILNFLV